MEFDMEEFYLKLNIENHINTYANIINVVKSFSSVYLTEKTITDFISNKEPITFEFVAIGKDNDYLIVDMFNNYNIDYRINDNSEYRFISNSKNIVLWTTDDLYSIVKRNKGSLLYDLTRREFLSLKLENNFEKIKSLKKNV